MARRMPISRVLSATTMVSVPTMLNAATTMMKKIMRPIASFSSWRALNRLDVLRLPVERAVGIAQPLLDGLADRGRLVRIGDPHGDPGHRVTQPGEALRHLPADHDELIVVLKHPGLEEAGHLELPEARHGDPESRVHLGLSHRNQGDDVAGIHRQPIGEPGAHQNAAIDAGLGRLEAEIALPDRLGQRGDRCAIRCPDRTRGDSRLRHSPARR